MDLNLPTDGGCGLVCGHGRDRNVNNKKSLFWLDIFIQRNMVNLNSRAGPSFLNHLDQITLNSHLIIEIFTMVFLSIKNSGVSALESTNGH
jgi:hypothetical protein